MRMIPRLGAAAALCACLTPGPWAAPSPAERAVFAARDRVFPALVHIEPILEVYQSGQRRRIAVTGSGVIFSKEGYVLTNNHVVERAERVTCTLSDRQELPASVVGRDPETDVAVIKLDLTRLRGPLPIAALGSSRTLQIGQQVLAMGSPLGLARSVSLGVISSLDRYLPEDQMPAGAATGLYNTWIQTDAAINPGNSGGPLVDLDGEVIGINARAVTVFGENVGFAIPIDIVKEVGKEIIAHGGIRRSWTGISWQPLKDLVGVESAEGLQGILVGGVAPNSPAEKAGVRAGDIVTQVNGQPLTVRFEEELPPFRKREADAAPGSALSLTLVRDGVTKTLQVVTALRSTAETEDFECREWGFTVRAVNEEIARARNLDQTTGVIVTGIKPGSFAAEAGLAPGQLIESLEGTTVDDLQTFVALYDGLVMKGLEKVLIVSKRGPILNWHVVKPSYAPASPRAREMDQSPWGDPEDEEGGPPPDDPGGSG